MNHKQNEIDFNHKWWPILYYLRSESLVIVDDQNACAKLHQKWFWILLKIELYANYSKHTRPPFLVLSARILLVFKSLIRNPLDENSTRQDKSSASWLIEIRFFFIFGTSKTFFSMIGQCITITNHNFINTSIRNNIIKFTWISRNIYVQLH